MMAAGLWRGISFYASPQPCRTDDIIAPGARQPAPVPPGAQLQTVMLPTSVVSVEILQADELSMSSQLPPLTDFPSTSQVLYGVRMSNTRQGAGFLADSLE